VGEVICDHCSKPVPSGRRYCLLGMWVGRCCLPVLICCRCGLPVHPSIERFGTADADSDEYTRRQNVGYQCQHCRTIVVTMSGQMGPGDERWVK